MVFGPGAHLDGEVGADAVEGQAPLPFIEGAGNDSLCVCPLAAQGLGEVAAHLLGVARGKVWPRHTSQQDPAAGKGFVGGVQQRGPLQGAHGLIDRDAAAAANDGQDDDGNSPDAHALQTLFCLAPRLGRHPNGRQTVPVV